MNAPEPPSNWFRQPQVRGTPSDAQTPFDDDDEAEEAAQPATVAVTFFDNYTAATKHEVAVDLAELARRIETTTGPDKSRLPWLKFGRFGDLRTEKNSLRHDANLLAISGIELDYDGEQISFDAAQDKLVAAGLLALLYTSPSHTEDGPRWRVICPTSQEFPPDRRDVFLARLNGLLGGIASHESWTRSQSYYFGSVNGNPSHRVAMLDGAPIDLADELDATAIGKPEKRKTNGDDRHGPASRPEDISDARIRGLVDKLLDNVRNARDGTKHHQLFDIGRTFGGYLHVIGWSEHEAVEQLVAALPSSVEDWDAARTTAAQAVALGATQPLELEDRPNPRPRRFTDQPPPETDGLGGDPPPPDDGPPPEWEKARPLAEGDVAVPGDPLLTEQFVMEAFIASFHPDLRFNHASSSWLVWNGHHWKPDERKLAFSWALKLCKQLARGGTAKGRLVTEKIRFSAAIEQGARAMPPISTAQEDWDNDPWRLGTPGGVVDLKTGILRDGAREDMITKVTAVTPVVSPDCPTWVAFLDYAMHGDDQLVRFLQRYFGYSLTGLTIEEIFLFLFGPGGAGKGTLMETVTHILGDYAGTAPMEVFTGVAWSPTEYYRADMVGKRLIVANEPERGAFWAEAFIKESTGGDTLSGRHPAGRPFRFKPTHKMALSGNHMPRLRGRSTGMERRLRILPFTRKPEIPDTSLKAKLIAEAPAILRWMIEGCLAWQKIGLQPPAAIRDANTQYFEAQDAFARWVDECCIVDRYLQLEPAPLRKSFNDWARANGEGELGGNAFAEAIDQFECTPPLKRVASHGKRWIKGIGLKPPPATARYGNDVC